MPLPHLLPLVEALRQEDAPLARQQAAEDALFRNRLAARVELRGPDVKAFFIDDERLVCLKVQQHCIERKKRTMRKWSGLVPFFVQLGTRPHLCSISKGAF